MDRRRLGAVGVLAAAVLAVAVGAGLSRPLTVGVASALPVDPPPQVGDCLYTGPPDWTSERSFSDDGESTTYSYGLDFRACTAPWNGEVVDVRHDHRAEPSAPERSDRPGVDGCSAGTALFVGRPDFTDPAGQWLADGPLSNPLPPDHRQSAVGQEWVACVLPTPLWDRSGRSTATSETGFAPSAESLRGQWRDPVARNRWGVCGIGPSGDGPIGLVYCGKPHDRERVAYTFWSEAPSAAALIDGCAVQAGRMTGPGSVLSTGVLTSEVMTSGAASSFGSEIVTALTDLADGGSAQCWVRPADPGMQLTSTVVSLGSAPPPLVPR